MKHWCKNLTTSKIWFAFFANNSTKGILRLPYLQFMVYNAHNLTTGCNSSSCRSQKSLKTQNVNTFTFRLATFINVFSNFASDNCFFKVLQVMIIYFCLCFLENCQMIEIMTRYLNLVTFGAKLHQRHTLDD